jgi:catechol 2,3-dioxygenase-like lactoylglutathione lyase family enzyme
MTNPIGHLQYNIRAESVGFYRDLLTHLGWNILFEDNGMLGAGSGNGQSLWFSAATGDTASSDAIGLDHLSFAAGSVPEVDGLAAWLAGRGIEPLYDTPRHRPEFASSEADTYYQVMFRSPDGILFELVYIGPRQHP